MKHKIKKVTSAPIKHIKENKGKLATTSTIIGSSILHHSDWTIHGILTEFTHNGFIVAFSSLAILLMIDFFTKRGGG